MKIQGHGAQGWPLGELYSRPANDLTPPLPLLVEAIAELRTRSCTMKGEAGMLVPRRIGQARDLYQSPHGKRYIVR
jgi:ATP-dependent DNA ligase